MTRFGKVLVFINLAFSLLMAAWAFALYSNRIDWSNQTAKADRPLGPYAVTSNTIKELQQALGQATEARRAHRAELLAEEAQRLNSRTWYAKEMEHLRSRADARDPARMVVMRQVADKNGPKGLPVRDQKTGFLQMAVAADRDGKPLRSLDAYNRDLATRNKEIHDVLAEYEALAKEDKALTDRIAPPDGSRGLYRRLIDEQEKRDNVIAEEKFVRPLLINTAVESELVLKRQKSLVKRIDELKKVGVAAR